VRLQPRAAIRGYRSRKDLRYENNSDRVHRRWYPAPGTAWASHLLRRSCLALGADTSGHHRLRPGRRQERHRPVARAHRRAHVRADHCIGGRAPRVGRGLLGRLVPPRGAPGTRRRAAGAGLSRSHRAGRLRRRLGRGPDRVERTAHGPGQLGRRDRRLGRPEHHPVRRRRDRLARLHAHAPHRRRRAQAHPGKWPDLGCVARAAFPVGRVRAGRAAALGDRAPAGPDPRARLRAGADAPRDGQRVARRRAARGLERRHASRVPAAGHGRLEPGVGGRVWGHHRAGLGRGSGRLLTWEVDDPPRAPEGRGTAVQEAGLRAQPRPQ
jgi:hypothetical protein